MIYKGYLLTPGVEIPGIDFIPKASPEDADEVVDREGDGVTAYALMGFDHESDRWEVLMVTYRPTTLVRRVRMMFGVELQWDGSCPLGFDRGMGLAVMRYMTEDGPRIIIQGPGVVATLQSERQDAVAAFCRRLGVTI